MKNILKKIIVGILTLEARAALARFKPKIVAVTGSVGKTSAKDAIYAVLATKFSVRKSEKSFNSEIGTPLTILGLPNGWNNPAAWLINIIKGAMRGIFNFQFSIFKREKYPEWLVLEIGADRPGDIKNLANWIKPDIVVITRFAKVPVHIEFFASPQQVIEEKMNLARALKEDGVLILNGDDDDILEAKGEIRRRTILYGFGASALIKASNEKIIYADSSAAPVGMAFKVDCAGSSVPVKISGVLGRQTIYAALAGLAVANSQNINLLEAAEALENLATPPGRMKILAGIKNSLIIDDTYNSSPIALEEALLTLKNLSANRRIAVLGDMLELGKHSIDEHKKAGVLAGSFVDLLVIVGKRAEGFAEGASKAGLPTEKIIRFENSRAAGEYLDGIITAGDIILIKGSQGMRMEQTVEEIMAEPENKGKLLVRQEKEWQNR